MFLRSDFEGKISGNFFHNIRSAGANCERSKAWKQTASSVVFGRYSGQISRKTVLQISFTTRCIYIYIYIYVHIRGRFTDVNCAHDRRERENESWAPRPPRGRCFLSVFRSGFEENTALKNEKISLKMSASRARTVSPGERRVGEREERSGLRRDTPPRKITRHCEKNRTPLIVVRSTSRPFAAFQRREWRIPRARQTGSHFPLVSARYFISKQKKRIVRRSGLVKYNLFIIY